MKFASLINPFGTIFPHTGARLDTVSHGVGPFRWAKPWTNAWADRVACCSLLTRSSLRPPDSVEVWTCTRVPSIARAHSDQRRSPPIAPRGVAASTPSMMQRREGGAMDARATRSDELSRLSSPCLPSAAALSKLLMLEPRNRRCWMKTLLPNMHATTICPVRDATGKYATCTLRSEE